MRALTSILRGISRVRGIRIHARRVFHLLLMSTRLFIRQLLTFQKNMNSRTQPYLLLALLATTLTLCSVRGEDKKPTDSDLQKLQGEWTMISGLADGSAVSE